MKKLVSKIAYHVSRPVVFDRFRSIRVVLEKIIREFKTQPTSRFISSLKCYNKNFTLNICYISACYEQFLHRCIFKFSTNNQFFSFKKTRMTLSPNLILNSTQITLYQNFIAIIRMATHLSSRRLLITFPIDVRGVILHASY